MADHASDTVSIVHNGRVIASPKVAAHPVAIAVDAITHRAYVVCRQAHRVVILHDGRRIRTIATPKHSLPSSVTVLPALDEVFVGEQGEFQDGDDRDTFIASGYGIIRGLRLYHHQALNNDDTVNSVSTDQANSYVLIGIGGGHSRLVRGLNTSIRMPYSNGGSAVADAKDVIWTTDGTSSLERITVR